MVKEAMNHKPNTKANRVEDDLATCGQNRICLLEL
jgi:hypothetical protein